LTVGSVVLSLVKEDQRMGFDAPGDRHCMPHYSRGRARVHPPAVWDCGIGLLKADTRRQRRKS
ncbi:MAG TPA: hypothetical protein VN083_05230, partial [Vicinamibacteria bacterium]|nr:hypothetical protein [Vicinamibacteria bacterium]